MRLAITADWQLGEQARFSHRLESGITSRLRDQVTCVEWIVHTALREGCTQLAVLGDIFDQRNAVTSSVLDQAGRVFQHVQGRFECEPYVLVGNHDAPLRTPALTSLRALSGLVHLIDAPTVVDAFAFVPWMDDPDDYRAAIGEVSTQKSARWLFSHMLVQGSVPMGKGLPLEALRPKRWRTIFLGDVHDPVSIDNAQYVGAPMQHHYGDAGGTRGFWILDTERGTQRMVENTVSPRFHVVTSTTDVRDSVREGDFVRVQVDESTVEAAVIIEARKRTRWVESRPVETEVVPPRLAIDAKQTQREVLERYAAYQLEGTVPKELVDTGAALLREVS